MISVIIVTRNAEKTLATAMSSVLSLEIENLELILVDGDSTDKTVAIIEQYLSLVELNTFGNKSITYISEKDDGIYDAMNKGVQIAGNDWVYFLGADDVVLPTFSTISSLLESKNTVYYFDSLIASTRCIYDGQFSTYKLCVKNICHQSIVYPRSLLLSNLFNLDYKIVADYFLNIVLWSNTSISFKYHPVVIAVFADYGVSSNIVDQKFYSEKYLIIKRCFGLRYALFYKIVRLLYSLLKGKVMVSSIVFIISYL